MSRSQKRLIKRSKKSYKKAWGMGGAGERRGKKLFPNLWGK